MHMTTTGIVLREVNYKESDKILTVLTTDAGKLTVSARGCRKGGNAAAALTQLLCYGEWTLYEYQNRWSLREGEVLREFRGVRADLNRLSLGAWFAELTETLAVEGESAPELLRLLLLSLYALESRNHPPELVKAVFELKMMDLTGYAPMLDACAVCGAEPEQPELHLNQGALHCRGCRETLGSGVSVPLEAGTLAAMRYVLSAEEKRLFSFRVSDAVLHNLSAVTEAFVLTQTERSFRTLDFYKQIAVSGA